MSFATEGEIPVAGRARLHDLFGRQLPRQDAGGRLGRPDQARGGHGADRRPSGRRASTPAEAATRRQRTWPVASGSLPVGRGVAALTAEPPAASAGSTGPATCSSPSSPSRSSSSTSCRSCSASMSASPSGASSASRAGSGSTTSRRRLADDWSAHAFVNIAPLRADHRSRRDRAGPAVRALRQPGLAACPALARTLLFTPNVVSATVIGLVWVWMLDTQFGVLNHYLGYLGIGPIPWLTSTQWSLVGVSIASIWWDMGLAFVLLPGGAAGRPARPARGGRASTAPGACAASGTSPCRICARRSAWW